jgi:hypothetical protein
MPERPPTPRQLDIPLVWEQELPGVPPSLADPFPPQLEEDEPVGLGRLWLGILADGGAVLLAVGLFWSLAAFLGAALRPPQLVVAAIAGFLCATVVALGCFWGWRGSPGMLLVGVSFADPQPFARAIRVWALWIAALPLLGLPLTLRVRGLTGAERAAGSRLRLRPPHAGA